MEGGRGRGKGGEWAVRVWGCCAGYRREKKPLSQTVATSMKFGVYSSTGEASCSPGSTSSTTLGTWWLTWLGLGCGLGCGLGIGLGSGLG